MKCKCGNEKEDTSKNMCNKCMQEEASIINKRRTEGIIQSEEEKRIRINTGKHKPTRKSR